MPKPKPKTIDEYINMSRDEVIPKLVQLNECIRKAAPDAVEGIKWGMPAYSMKKILVTFAVFKEHIGFFPMPSAVEHFAKELTKYKTAKGSIQLPLDKPLPLPLIRKIVKFRVKENNEGTIKWFS